MKKKLTKKDKRRVILGCFFALVFSLLMYHLFKKPDSYYIEQMDYILDTSSLDGPYSYMESALMEVEGKEQMPLILDRSMGVGLKLDSHHKEMERLTGSANTAGGKAAEILKHTETFPYTEGDETSLRNAETGRTEKVGQLVEKYGKHREDYQNSQQKAQGKANAFDKRIADAAELAQTKQAEHDELQKIGSADKVTSLNEGSTLDVLYAAVRYCRAELERITDEAEANVINGEWPVEDDEDDVVSAYYKERTRDIESRLATVKQFEERLAKEVQILQSWKDNKSERPDVKLVNSLNAKFEDDAEAKRIIESNIRLKAQKPAQQAVEQTPKFVIAATSELTESLVLPLLKDWLAKQGKTEINVQDSAKGRDVYAGEELQVRVSPVELVTNPAETLNTTSAALVFRACRKAEVMLQDRDAALRESVVCLDGVVYYTSDSENTSQTISEVESASRYFFAPGSSPRVLSDMCGIMPGEIDRVGTTQKMEEAIREAGERLIVGSYHVQHDMLYANRTPVSLRSMKTGMVLNPIDDPTLLLNEYPLNLVQDIRVARKADMAIPEANSFCLYLTDMDAACAPVIVECCYVPVLQTAEKRTEETVLRSKDIEVRKVLEALESLAKNKHGSTLEKEFGYSKGSDFLLGKYMPYSMHYDVGKSEGTTENIVFNCRDCEFHLGVLGKDMLRMLEEHGKIAVIVVGHADVTGNSRNNQTLSEARAVNYVESVLQAQGFLKNDERRNLLQFNNLNKVYRNHAIWGTNTAGSVYVVTIGCGDKRAEVTETYVAEQKELREAYNQKELSEDELKQLRADYFRRDRRAQIFVIVPNKKK